VRVLLWATTLQADILALAIHLDRRLDCSLLVVAEHAASFSSSPVARLLPLSAPVLDRDAPGIQALVEQFKADVVVCDNHFPPFNAAPRVCAMWHGLGWKARPSGELPSFFKHVKRLTGGDPRSPNPRFMAQCYHERDFAWRTEQWGLAADNCTITGSCFADLLRHEAPYSSAALEAEYGLDLSKRTVLVNITWHFGRIFPGSWQPKLVGSAPFEEDVTFLRELVGRVRDRGANVIFCLHDRKRYEAGYLDAIRRLGSEFGDGISFRHKDQHPDNWADLWIADVMVSNLSSLSTFFYHSGRPAVHLCPSASADEIPFAQYSWLGLHRRLRKSSMPLWMNDPNDNGGLSATTPAEAFVALDAALSNPDCCKRSSSDWLARHVSFPQPSASDCLAQALEQLSRS
jgi:hypothetical protein